MADFEHSVIIVDKIADNTKNLGQKMIQVHKVWLIPSWHLVEQYSISWNDWIDDTSIDNSK